MSGHIVVVANGVFSRRKTPQERLRALVRGADTIVAADGGVNWLQRQGLAPAALIGDLDSARPTLVRRLASSGCVIQRYLPTKDETDTELALLYAAREAPESITIIGALGGRLDHELGNIMLLALPALRGIATAIYDGTSWVRLLQAGQMIVHGSAGDTVSLLPLGGDCQGVRTSGLGYPLNDETLRFGPARGVSNFMLSEKAQIEVRVGRLLVVHTPTEERRP